MDLQRLSDSHWVADKLNSAGLSGGAAAGKADLFRRCFDQLDARGTADAVSLFVPGRLEVLGKHTDYCGGRSLLAAVERGICAIAVGRADLIVRMRGVAPPAENPVEFDLSPDLLPRTGHWANYPMTVSRRVAGNFPGNLRGAEIIFASDLPVAAGMSSSSAMVVMTFFALWSINRLYDHKEFRLNIRSHEDWAEYLGSVENGQTYRDLPGDRGVGTFGGSEDHTAMLCSRPGQLVQYSFRPVRFERAVPVPLGQAFAIACSGVAAEKTGDAMEKYNRTSRLARACLETWNAATGRHDSTLAAAAEAAKSTTPVEIVLSNAKHPEFTSFELVRRFAQFNAESNHYIAGQPSFPGAIDALACGDLNYFGKLVDVSQGLAETILQNQTSETTWLARRARDLGATAATSFGAGFGGSVWAMIDEPRALDFLHQWSTAYRAQFPQRAPNAEFFLTRPGPPVVEF